MCVKRGETEREAVSSNEIERKWQTWLEERKGKEWKTTPERLRGEPTAPSQPSSSSSVCFAMVTRQGSQCSQLMCFSVAGASGVLMCLSPSPAQSMSTVLGCTNTWRAESQGTLGHPGWASGRESERGPRHNYLKAALVFCEVVRQLWQWSFVLFWRSLISHVDHYYIDL